jgi:tRNA wybutosine-synthesizing protein 3
MTSRFDTKKRKILALLEIPDEEYHDLSPKGSVDEPIRPLIRDINRLPGLVTTSSCSGRVSVFAEGKKNEVLESELDQNGGVVRAGPGGKGSGSWLYVSHSPIEVSENAQDLSFLSMFGLKPRSSHALGPPTMRASYIHLKFEPMVRLGSLFKEKGDTDLWLDTPHIDRIFG